MTSWSDAGFVLDPDGDAARRAALASARPTPDDLRDPTGLARLAASRLAPATLTGSAAPLLVPRDPEPPEQPAGHEVTTAERDGIGYAVCECGEWEAGVTGARSARWAYEQYREHLRAVGLG